MRWGQNNTSRLSRSPALSARFSRGFVPVLAAAVGVASAAFAVPPAALAEAPGASTPTQVASPPAASVTDADKRVVADLLFKRLLLKPDDLDAGFQYAQLETELGDYEAAIGALERILYYDPNLPRVKLQLGMLYFHLRSYEMARNCFDAVLNAPDVPPDIRTEVQTYVAAVDKAVAINPRSTRGCPILSRRPRSRIWTRCGRSRPRPAFPRQWRVSGTLDTSFSHNIGFTLQVQYLRTYSTISNYSLPGCIVAAGPTFHFRPLGHS
jgi:tetratricopeptide (TPR) repeat protein